MITKGKAAKGAKVKVTVAKMMAETEITNVEPGATPTIVVAARTQLSWHAKMRVHFYEHLELLDDRNYTRTMRQFK